MAWECLFSLEEDTKSECENERMRECENEMLTFHGLMKWRTPTRYLSANTKLK